MNRTEKLGVAILTSIALFFAAVVAGLVVLEVGMFRRGDGDIGTLGRVIWQGGFVIVATAVTWGAIREGKGAVMRWALVAVLALSVPFLSLVAVLTARPLADPAEQAIWEQDYWWIVPVTWAGAAVCLVSALLLCLPPVGEALRYLKRPGAEAAGEA